MLFNSYIFIFVFLPITLFLYYTVKKIGNNDMAKFILIGMSLWFYAYFRVEYLGIILFSIFMNYAVVCICDHCRSVSLKQFMIGIGVLGNIALILYYKYVDFLIQNINTIGGTEFATKDILMPLGISFFTFQQISFLIDTYRGETKEYRFVDYLLFVTFFPQLVAGPIVTHSEMIPQFRRNPSFSWDGLAEGIYMFVIGLSKKVLLADIFGRLVDFGFSISGELTTVETMIVALGYTLQIYYDFSGYCDMASGIAKMFGIILPINFYSPYKSTSIADFWDRWHISLTRFFRTYLYFPLGGSRKGKIRTYVNILIVFLVSGIWHGAAWTYVAWGIYNGILMVLYRMTKNIWEKIPKFIKWFLNFLLLNLGWIMFRAGSLTEFGIMADKLIHWRAGGIRTSFFECFDVIEYTYIVDHIPVLARLDALCAWIPMLLFMAIGVGIAVLTKNIYEKKFVPTVWNAVGSIVLLGWSVLSLSGVTTFLYFNF